MGQAILLSPSDSDINESFKKEVTSAREYARKLNVVILSDKAKEEKENEDDSGKIKQNNNQKLGLCESLLAVGDWNHAEQIIKRLPQYSATAQPPIAQGLCALLHIILDPLYRQYSGLPAKVFKYTPRLGLSVTQCHTFGDLVTVAFPMLAYLGPSLSCDPKLMVKLIRVLKTFMEKRRSGELMDSMEPVFHGLLTVLDEVLIPSLCMMNCNCGMSEEIWALLKYLPYEHRYLLYGHWKNETYNIEPRLIKIRADCLERAKYIMKRLSKENVKPSGRQIGKLSHSNPGVIFEYGGYFAQVKNIKKSSNRLKETLLEHDLAIPMCLLMVQQRDCIVYQEGGDRFIKLVGKLYDQCQDTLVQFGSFLSTQLSTEEFVKRLPSIEVLVGDYHVAPDAAFFLSRPMYTHAINTKFDELRKIDKSNKNSTNQLKTQRYIEAAASVMEPVIEAVKPVNSPKVWEEISPQFYVTFWSLSIYDLHVPSVAYNKQMDQLRKVQQAVDETKDMAQSKKKKERERCFALIDKLKDEERKQEEHVQRVVARLKGEKDNWIPARSTKNDTITQFLQVCIFPRCCFTASDAVYCAKFIEVLHELKTPNFSTLICYDRIYCDITYTVACCTENEAHRYGRFLCAAFETIMRWHSDKAVFEKECGSHPGFVTVYRKTDTNNKTNQHGQLDYENYRHICHKWQFRTTKAMVACLESGDYGQIRNALIVLTKVLQYYPKVLNYGQALERRVDRIRQEEKEKRPDIYALAMGYIGQLKSKKNTWIPEQEFHIKENTRRVQSKQGTTVKTNSQSAPVKSEPNGTGTAATASENGKTTSSGRVKEEKDVKQEGKERSKESREREVREGSREERRLEKSDSQSSDRSESRADTGKTPDSKSSEKKEQGGLICPCGSGKDQGYADSKDKSRSKSPPSERRKSDKKSERKRAMDYSPDDSEDRFDSKKKRGEQDSPTAVSLDPGENSFYIEGYSIACSHALANL
ncbi:THO complex subunit 2-like [Lingula anatina]|uniref:THO complex subunit 2-like n=1 Tax=Lingula anatina TaxID=7574 RepID=A0A1S3JIQ2_LINAN|nr:THO complex subunit 2-like [Lingula anatina]|eukprot:XP_013410006.1 THO complex subunit 2-like [Lingula anatina]